MVGVLDNKNIAELVIEQDNDEGYLKINPETLATIVEDVTKTEDSSNTESVSYTVQEHIDDESIHLSVSDVQVLTSSMLTVDDIIAGNNITVERVDESNNIKISSADFDDAGFVKVEEVIPEDDTITITPNTSNDGFKIRANIPDTSQMVKQKNIKAANESITITYDEDSNDVYVAGYEGSLQGGEGIEISNLVVTNTAPDQEVTITAGTNIEVDGDYPDFTIHATDIARIADWETQTNYQIGSFVVYENAFFQCIEAHRSGTAFESDKWKLIAGWSLNRQYFTVEEETDSIVLSDVVASKEMLIVNVGGIFQQSTNYDLQPDGQTLKFVNTIPQDTQIEVIVMSNVVLSTYNTEANIHEWEANTAYAEGNIVLYENNLYICIERHTSDEEFELSKWSLMAGYLKTTYRFDPTEDITELTLPVIMRSKELVEVNVSNTILLQSTYEVDNYTLRFNKTIEAGLPIEVSVYNSGSITLPAIPDIEGKVQYFLTTDDTGLNYVLRSTDDVLEILNLGTLLNYEEHAGSIITIKDDGSGYEYIDYPVLADKIKSGQLLSGLELSVTSAGRLRVEAGGTISDNNNVLLVLDEATIKTVSSTFSAGSSGGSAAGYDLTSWEQPIMTSNFSNGYQIITSDYITDREGWRAMDGTADSGNGWLVNGTSATFSLICANTIELHGFGFYNTTSGSSNHSKEIDVWVDNESNVVASFTALDEDYGYSYVEFENTIRSKTVGFTIKSSYGSCVGAKEVVFIGEQETEVVANALYYVYLIGDENGGNVDVITSPYNLDEIENYLPSSYVNYALIGTFITDSNVSISELFPNKTLKREWIEGSLNGTIGDGKITTRMYLEGEEKPVDLVEQFGESTPSNGRVTFPESFTELLYVMANGEKVLSKDNEGFTVDSGITSVSWVAKGYK